MIEKNQKLRHLLSQVKNEEEFFKAIIHFFETSFSSLSVDFCRVFPWPPYYMKILNSKDKSSLLNSLRLKTTFIKKDEYYTNNEICIYPLGDLRKPESIIIFEQSMNNTLILQYCRYISELYNLLKNNFNDGYHQSSIHHANLISQISHDINSFINNVKSETGQSADILASKINYLTKMTKDILHYVREIEILVSEVKIKELFFGIISKIDFPSNVEIISKIETKDTTIRVDVELIDRAISEIIENAIAAIKERKGKIKILCLIESFENIFNKSRFLTIKIENDGDELIYDFTEQILNPFFTTRKAENHSGLGLAIADKIVKAHQGNLKIDKNTDGKTTVNIYLPIKGIMDE